LTAREPVSAIEKPIVIGSPLGAFAPGAALWADAPWAANSRATNPAKIYFAIMFPPMSVRARYRPAAREIALLPRSPQ
jgi:hypothetical protein